VKRACGIPLRSADDGAAAGAARQAAGSEPAASVSERATAAAGGGAEPAASLSKPSAAAAVRWAAGARTSMCSRGWMHLSRWRAG